MSIDYSVLKAAVVADLTTELSGEPGFSAAILGNKVEMAIQEVILRRNYSASSLTDTQISEDLSNFRSTIVNVARYDYNQIGAEGQSAHSENSVSRTWIDRNTLFNGVIAFVKVL